MASDPQLNSLTRFRKQAGRLVLEEHGHCEVPAGCGGVVLRWRDPSATFPLTLRLYTPAPVACFLDGAEVRTGLVDLSPGRHAAAFALQEVDLSAGLLLFAATLYEARAGRTPPVPPAVIDFPLRVLSAEDGSWKWTLQEPVGEQWKMDAFEDRDWLALTHALTPQLDRGAPGAYQCRECVEQGAICLGLPATSRDKLASTIGRVWIRKVFEIPLPRFSQPGQS